MCAVLPVSGFIPPRAAPRCHPAPGGCPTTVADGPQAGRAIRRESRPIVSADARSLGGATAMVKEWATRGAPTTARSAARVVRFLWRKWGSTAGAARGREGATMGGAVPALPWVTIKYAQSLDGRIATRSGESQWISGSDSLVYAHELRAQHDAILVGVGTVLRDNPRLTVRLVEGRDPLRVIADSALRTPLDAALLDEPRSTLLAATAAAEADRRATLEARGARVIVLPAEEDGRVDLQ